MLKIHTNTQKCARNLILLMTELTEQNKKKEQSFCTAIFSHLQTLTLLIYLSINCFYAARALRDHVSIIKTAKRYVKRKPTKKIEKNK